jgi:formylglycine-generating enzyme required for sulfatase activity
MPVPHFLNEVNAMMRTRLYRRPFIKISVLCLCLLLLKWDLPLQPDSDQDRYLGMFNWAKKYYLEGKYRETEKKLEMLLSYLEGTAKDSRKTSVNDEYRRLLGNIWLLLGASCERMGNKKEAIKYYRQAKTVSDRLKAAGEPGIEIEELDFFQLPEGRKLILSRRQKAIYSSGLMIAKEVKKKKKKISPFLVFAGIAAVTAVVLAYLFKKKRETAVTDTAFDTGEMNISWVRIVGGPFFMGSRSDIADADEQPRHEVDVRTFYISTHEITFDQYRKFLHENPAYPDPTPEFGQGRQPVINVPWERAEAFCIWLSRKTGKAIFLPTEAQWEKATTGYNVTFNFPTYDLYPWGNQSPDCNRANWCCWSYTREVGSHPNGATPRGVHDMAGNVAEWCRDWYQENYYSVSPSGNPLGPQGDGSLYDYYKVVRGGSWICDTDPGIRCTDRGKRQIRSTGPTPKLHLYNDVGFRIVWEPN